MYLFEPGTPPHNSSTALVPEFTTMPFGDRIAPLDSSLGSDLPQEPRKSVISNKQKSVGNIRQFCKIGFRISLLNGIRILSGIAPPP